MSDLKAALTVGDLLPTIADFCGWLDKEADKLGGDRLKLWFSVLLVYHMMGKMSKISPHSCYIIAGKLADKMFEVDEAGGVKGMVH